MKNNTKIKPELIAPAGNLEKMKTAFAFGADAVYLGIPDFSLRVRVNDFTLAGIDEATKYAHKIGKKVYATVNIFAHNKHLKKLPGHIEKLKKIGVDGLFISDPAVLGEVKRIWPKAKIILSTQANCTNWQAAIFWLKQGAKRIILSRELELSEIKEIKKRVPKLELECFIHGALCMAYSGRCFLSKYFNDRNANLGDCSQPCRWDYFISAENHETLELVEEKNGSYILNSKDLCLIKRVPEMIEAGISAFKIEGRAKSVYYLANVVGAYRKAIDVIQESKKTPLRQGFAGQAKKQKNNELKFLYEELEEKLYHRGYTEGFMFREGKAAQNLDNSHKIPEWEFCGQVIKNRKYGKGKIFVKAHNTMKVGDELEILRPSYDIIKMRLKRMADAKTGEKIKEAHGGGSEDVVILEVSGNVPEYSVLRRRVKIREL
ncbi:MAG: U32 family peptidase C-terminal domain-containing protein [Patescibacteria group bacterium]|nr:U32 family peptidase C-terminal domain-containing protein [Patescibacteria group bacterium]MDD5554604.1 U32 family peptidase C-terminal domain-containing protein [Patescibacteria group bacterium]